MPSKKPYIMIRTKQEIIDKFQIIADSENRSMSNLGETLLIKAINEYESQNGKIETEEKQGIHIQNSNGVVVRDNKGQVIVGDIKGNVHM